MSETLNVVDAISSLPVQSADHPAAPVNDSPAPPGAATTAARDFASRPVLMLGLLLLVAIAFANSISGEFVHDDIPQILHNQMFNHWDRATLTRVLTRDFWAALQPEQAGSHLNSLYYRPVFSLFLMAGYEVVGRNPAGWHLLTILLHALCAILAFIILEKSLQQAGALADRPRRLLAACAAAVFAAHPAQSESVAWIAGLVGPLSVIFVLTAFYCYLRHRERQRLSTQLSMLLLFALAVLTKESAIVLLLIVPAHELLIFNRGARAVVRLRLAARYAWPLVLIGAGYMLLRYLTFGIWFGRVVNLNFPDDQALTAVGIIRTWPALLIAYGKLIIWPVDLSLMYNFGYVGRLGWTSLWLPLLILLASCWMFLRAAAHNTEARLGAIWLVLPLLPHLNTRAFVSDEIIHDRYLYLSLLGAGLLVGALLMQAATKVKWMWPRPALVLIVGLLAMLTGLTLATNQRFQNNGVLWTHIAAHAPKSRIALLAMGLVAESRGDKAAALQSYEAALVINPDIVDALNNSAFIYARSGHWDEATRRFERIVELSPDRAGGHFNLSFAYAVQRRYAEAIEAQQRALELDPHNARAAEWQARLVQLKQTVGAASGQREERN
jgi:protein O-mannosyl-transferase